MEAARSSKTLVFNHHTARYKAQKTMNHIKLIVL